MASDLTSTWYQWRSPEHVLACGGDPEDQCLLWDHDVRTPRGPEESLCHVGAPGDCVGNTEVSPDGSHVIFTESDTRPHSLNARETDIVGIDELDIPSRSTVRISWRRLPPDASLAWCGDNSHYVVGYCAGNSVVILLGTIPATDLRDVAQFPLASNERFAWLVSGQQQGTFFAIYDLGASTYRIDEVKLLPIVSIVRSYHVRAPEGCDYPEVCPAARSLLWTGFEKRKWPARSVLRNIYVAYVSDMSGGHLARVATIEMDPLAQLIAFDRDGFDAHWIPGGTQVSVLYRGALYAVPVPAIDSR